MSAEKAKKELELSNLPSDGISSIVFHPLERDKLLVTSWDKGVRLYDVTKDELVSSHTEHRGAVLCGCFSRDGSSAFSGGLDGRIIRWSEGFTKAEEFGTHDKAVSCMDVNETHGLLVTGGWDAIIRIWDQSDAPGQLPVHSLKVPERVYSLSTVGDSIVAALADRRFAIYDIRELDSTKLDGVEPTQLRDSSLKYQIRCVRMMPSGSGFVAGSIEGRVAVEYIDMSSEAQSKKYAFRCHRQQVDGADVIYPVNAISFHPVHHTFATGGEDGTVCLWDGFNKKRIKLYPTYPTSVSAVGFNCDGTLLAVASSYTYAQGEKEHPKDQIFVRTIGENEAKPKAKK